MKNKILLRADDLGYSEAVNYGIEKAVKQGVIKSVGVMLNMDATVHGVKLLQDEDIAFGQHTNICIGHPITDPKMIPSLTSNNGEFKTSKEYRETKEDFVVFEEALIEIEAQYNRFIDLFDREPDYFEGHAIASENFFKALEYFAREHNLKYSGLPANQNPNSLEGNDSYIFVNDTKVYLTMESMMKSYDPLETFKRMIENLHEDGVDMMIFHPGYLDQFILNNSSLLIPRTQEVEMLTAETTIEIIKSLGLEMLSYKEI